MARTVFDRKAKTAAESGAKLLSDDPFFDLIEDAYRVFATHKPSNTEVCVDHCMPQAIADDFFTTDIRDLPLRYLEEWYSAAAATGGVSKHIWTYLLPRILEVLVSGKTPSALGSEVILARYPGGSEKEWSHKQWQILDAFQRRYLEREIALGPNCQDCFLDDILCMFRLGGWNHDDLFAQLMAAPIDQLAERLWRDWCEDFGEYGLIWVTTFWEPKDEVRRRDFYISDELHSRLLDLALSDTHSKRTTQKASDLVSIIERAAFAK